MKKHLKIILAIGALSLVITACNTNTSSLVNSSTNSSLNETSSSFKQSSSESSSSSSIAPKKYTITWKNYDGAVLEVDDNVLENTLPTYDGPNPNKASDAQYNYVWSGWSPEVEPAKADTIYTATFNEELRKYTIVWKDEDGTVLETDSDVPYGEMPEFNESEPTKESTVENTYAFAGWSPEVLAVTGDATYVATYQENVRKYNVIWKNEDGTVIKNEEVAYGETPSYEGETPTKDSTNQYKYTFDGWSPNVVEVTGDVEYTAIYKEEIRTYTVTWANFDGTVLEVDELEYGQTPVFNGENPTRPNDHGLSYSWKGWSPTIVPVYRDTTYTAKYTYDAFFDFSLLDYELKEGHTVSEIKGYPWINSNLPGQINLIEKPSLKDDFYASVNYDKIINNEPGAFEVDDILVSQALTTIYYGDGENTTNGKYLQAVYKLLFDGDCAGASAYFNSFNIDEYLSSKAIFACNSSYLILTDTDTGFKVSFNDGYVNSDVGGLSTFWFLGQYYSEYVNMYNSIIYKLKDVLNLNISSSEVNSVITLDRQFVNAVYNDDGYGADSKYTVDTVPWSQLKDALLDAGISSSSEITIAKNSVNALNYLFNNFASSDADTLKNDIILRLAFDYRFIIGADNYKYLLPYIANSGLFYIEQSLTAYTLQQLPQAMLRVMLKEAFEQSYIELSTGEEVKQTVANLIEDILTGYEELFNEITWLSEATKTNIIRKLSKMKYESCYSDKYKNFSKVDDSNLDASSLFELSQRYEEATIDNILKGNGYDPFSWAWGMLPSYTTNAFYTTSYNAFVILNAVVPGMLGTRVEELYGMLGAVIGHEITHAFDANGSKYDENGRNNDLMKGTDRTKFDRKVSKMVNFLDKINLYDDEMVKGSIVNTEATADMGGVKIMLKLAESIPDFDYDVFFRSFANLWCTQPYSDYYIQALLNNEHPYAYIRVNLSLAQFDEFIETYDLGPGDGMYIPENQRVSIW